MASRAAAQRSYDGEMAAVNSCLPQTKIVTTNGSGQATWTFATPFAAPPVISALVEATSNRPYDVDITALSATAVTIQVRRSAVVSVLGIDVLGAPVSAGVVNVHLYATKAT